MINTSLSEIDQALKKRSTAYNGVRSKLAQMEKKSTASLVTRPLNDLVKPSHLVHGSEYLETLFVVVPLRNEEEWVKSYENLCDKIVPRSSEKVMEDQEHALFTITV